MIESCSIVPMKAQRQTREKHKGAECSFLDVAYLSTLLAIFHALDLFNLHVSYLAAAPVFHNHQSRYGK